MVHYITQDIIILLSDSCLKDFCNNPFHAETFFSLLRYLLLSVRAESLFEHPSEVDVSLQSAEFLGPLQYRTWRKMSLIFKPGVDAHTQTHYCSLFQKYMFPLQQFQLFSRPYKFLISNSRYYTNYLKFWGSAPLKIFLLNLQKTLTFVHFMFRLLSTCFVFWSLTT